VICSLENGKKKRSSIFFPCSALADVKPKLCGSLRACVAELTRVCGEPPASSAPTGAVLGGVWVHVCLSPGGLFRSAECGRVYLISDVPSVFSADINCQTMSNGAQMFPGGGLPPFASTMRVIKIQGGVTFGPLFLQGCQWEHAGGLQVRSPMGWGCPRTGSSRPSPSAQGAGHGQRGGQGAGAVRSETCRQTG